MPITPTSPQAVPSSGGGELGNILGTDKVPLLGGVARRTGVGDSAPIGPHRGAFMRRVGDAWGGGPRCSDSESGPG